MLEALKKIDAFPKALDEYRIKTSSGAVVSILSVLLMLSLFFSEMNFYFKTEIEDHLYINTTRSYKLKVDFDFSFPEVACNLLSVDAFDDSGTSQENVVHEIYKHRLSPTGVKEGFPEKQDLGNTLQSEAQLEQLAKENAEKQDLVIKEQIGSCGNCYGAGLAGQCCQTCQDVKDAYERIGWRFKPQGIIQCTSEAYLSNMKDQFAEDGGCQIYGRLELNKGTGHFHIAPHKKLHQGGNKAGVFNLMDLISFTFDQFNITHTINSLSFGDNFPGINSPLDGQFRSVEDTHAMYQYFIKVVPTRYKALGKSEEIQSNQYSVTEHRSHLAPGSGRGLPGVYFNYEVSPIQARFEEKRGSFLSFLISVCAIVGGLFTVMGVVDALVGAAGRIFFRRGSLLD